MSSLAFGLALLATIASAAQPSPVTTPTAVASPPAKIACRIPAPHPGDPPSFMFQCNAGVPDEWLTHLRTIRYRSPAGDDVMLARALGNFAVHATLQGPPWVKYDGSSGLLMLCTIPSYEDGCLQAVYLRARDVGVPQGAVSAHLDDPQIGMTPAQLLAGFTKDEHFAGKTLAKGPHGDVIAIQAAFSDPGPKQYDHGMQSWSYCLYLFDDGVVSATACQHAEN